MLSILYKEKLLHVTYIALASILPFLAVRITGKLLQIREYNNAGNAWSTLYGLINGNADWRLAYSNLRRSGEPSDYEASLEIRQMALEGFRNDPLQAMKSVAINVFQMLTGNHPFFLPDNFSAGLLGIVFSIFLLFLLLIAIRSSFRFNSGSNCRIPWVYCYILLTTLISYGIFWKSEASRVMTTSLPILAALTLIVIRPRRLANISGNRRVTIRNLVPPLLFVITLPTLIISNHSVGDHLQKDLTRQCSGQQFYFVPRTITSQDVELVKKFGLFEWESSIESLDTGFLVIGDRDRRRQFA
jgi:hypothetical protein